MKKVLIILLIVSFFLLGCAKQGDVSQPEERVYEKVHDKIIIEKPIEEIMFEERPIQVGDMKINFPASIDLGIGKSTSQTLRICNIDGMLNSPQLKLEAQSFPDGLTVKFNDHSIDNSNPSETVSLANIGYQKCTVIPLIIIADIEPSQQPFLIITVYSGTEIYHSIGTIISVSGSPFEKQEPSVKVEEEIIKIGSQGGYLELSTGTYREYDGDRISYLCYNIKDSPRCERRDLSKQDLEEQLAKAIKSKLDASNVVVAINPTNVIVVVDDEPHNFDYPLGELYDVSQDIIDFETTSGEFDQLSYMLAFDGLYKIEKLRPYPDKIYKLNKKDDDYIFQFAVQGEAS